jgi:ABC-type multidrug transport system ATPase subunit
MLDSNFSIQLEQVGKKFNYDWIIRNLDLNLFTQNSYAINGPNGSGKSTLIKLLSGHSSPSVGIIHFKQNDKNIDLNDVYKHVSIAAPYIDIIEELDIYELLDFHFKLKKLRKEFNHCHEIVDFVYLTKVKGKVIKNYSSGMKQRLKLGLAIATEAPILLLDEPTTNLDAAGIEWYRTAIDQYCKNQLLVIASNTDYDFDFCNERINIESFKKI